MAFTKGVVGPPAKGGFSLPWATLLQTISSRIKFHSVRQIPSGEFITEVLFRFCPFILELQKSALDMTESSECPA